MAERWCISARGSGRDDCNRVYNGAECQIRSQGRKNLPVRFNIIKSDTASAHHDTRYIINGGPVFDSANFYSTLSLPYSATI